MTITWHKNKDEGEQLIRNGTNILLNKSCEVSTLSDVLIGKTGIIEPYVEQLWNDIA